MRWTYLFFDVSIYISMFVNSIISKDVQWYLLLQACCCHCPLQLISLCKPSDMFFFRSKICLFWCVFYMWKWWSCIRLFWERWGTRESEAVCRSWIMWSESGWRGCRDWAEDWGQRKAGVHSRYVAKMGTMMIKYQ